MLFTAGVYSFVSGELSRRLGLEFYGVGLSAFSVIMAGVWDGSWVRTGVLEGEYCESLYQHFGMRAQ